MQFDSLELQKNIEEKRLILGEKIERFLLKKLAKISAFFARVFTAKYTAFFGSVIIIAISALAQSSRDLGHDSVTYLEIAERMLGGGKYYYDFFEANLPLNFLLTTIPLFFARIFDFNVFATAEIFWNLLGILSIYSSSRILARLKDRTVFNLLILAFSAGFFWRVFTLQFNEFGTKTTYLLALLFPYISYHLLDESKLKNSDQILIGLLAGLLFCLKPNYGIFVIVFEGAKLIKSRQIFCLRNYTTLALLIGYLAILFTCFPTYIDKLPTLSSSYYDGANNLIFYMITHDIFPIFLFSVLCFEFIKKEPILQRLFLPVIAAAFLILSELIGGFDQRCVFYAVAWPLVLLLIFSLIKNHSINWSRDFLLLIPILLLPQFDAQSVFSTALYLGCFWWIFAFFLLRKLPINFWMKIGLIGLAVASVLALATNNFTAIPWVISLIIFIFVLHLNQKFSTQKEFSRSSVCAVFLVLSYFISLDLAAIFNFKNYYDAYKFSSPNHFTSEMIKAIKHYSAKDESILSVSEGLAGIYPAITYAGKKNELPFLQYGILFKKISAPENFSEDTAQYMIARLKEQLASKKNKLVFVEIQRHSHEKECPIGLLEYYFRDAQFKKIFLENYVFLTRITNVMEGPEHAKIIDRDTEIYIRK